MPATPTWGKMTIRQWAGRWSERSSRAAERVAIAIDSDMAKPGKRGQRRGDPRPNLLALRIPACNLVACEACTTAQIGENGSSLADRIARELRFATWRGGEVRLDLLCTREQWQRGKPGARDLVVGA